jgi:hypothetical protein
MADGPMFATVWPARTAKLSAVPRPTGGCAANAALASSAIATTNASANNATLEALAAPPCRHGGWMCVLEGMGEDISACTGLGAVVPSHRYRRTRSRQRQPVGSASGGCVRMGGSRGVEAGEHVRPRVGRRP